MLEAQEALPATVFIPEQYLRHREFLTELVGHGWGIQIPASELGASIQSGRVAVQILPANFIAIVHETAIDPNL